MGIERPGVKCISAYGSLIELGCRISICSRFVELQFWLIPTKKTAVKEWYDAKKEDDGGGDDDGCNYSKFHVEVFSRSNEICGVGWEVDVLCKEMFEVE